MRHDHDDATLRAHCGDCTCQGLLALLVEMGIRLIKHDQEGIAIEGPREAHALALADREGRAPVPNTVL